MLEGDSLLLDTAREVTRILRAAKMDGAVIGGVAVVLHGHLRTTSDVDVFTPDLDATAAALRAAGFRFDRRRREFTKAGVPVQLVTVSELRQPPAKLVEIEGIAVPSLPDLVTMKLRSGAKSVLRAQDLADVIGLIRARRLTGAFARCVAKDVRAEYRRLAAAVRDG